MVTSVSTSVAKAVLAADDLPLDCALQAPISPRAGLKLAAKVLLSSSERHRRRFAKVRVAASNPVVRSSQDPCFVQGP